MKLVGALDGAGIELIGEGVPSASGGRGVRLKAAAHAGAPPGKATRAANSSAAETQARWR